MPDAPRLADRRDETAGIQAVSDVAELGAKVLRALDEGRAKAISEAKKRGDASRDHVLSLAELDVHAGRADRGRAGRIARKLKGALRESQVQRILRTLSSVRD